MKKLLSVLLAFTGSIMCLKAQVTTKPLLPNQIPATAKYIGKVVKALQLSDASGTYITFTTETGITAGKEEDMRKAALYAYCYKVNGKLTTAVWQVKDFVDDCPVDVKANFVPGSFTVTDLDNNGIAEIWMLYQTACRGDVSPDTMKLIMYQGNKKHAMRGTTKVEVSAKNYEGGTYNMDQAFQKVKPVIKQYAVALWNKNVKQKWE
ncbi:M949_RS01915 family surface polysaccharide biosynthesis protein [Mucilaginibacter terrae]|uniref:DUF4468 domain-containing protein n=1 Tax=Mucilaginibacter terrae TaxID=1955052 RepID=A0ABU3GS30_9SPHI|nr:hypothetical protein [Mucilaginibacter terrae]MDT3402587.1 hypothetical protein [Mucilaginibacter terrae]